MKTIDLAFMGFGNCGQAVARLLMSKHEEIEQAYGIDVRVTAIVTNRKGNLINPEGIDLLTALQEIKETGEFKTDRSAASAMEIVETAEYDALVEMSPLNIKTGEPATTYIKTAFSRGKHVVTANKGPIAWHYRELKDMATKRKVGFFHETVVMDGAPVFNMAELTLKLAKVTEVSGILNTTTNFILEELAKGGEYDEVMERGRAMGFVEADPSLDIEGHDAAAKLTALINVLMDGDITPDMVEREGIENITKDDILEAAAGGKKIKLLCRGWRSADGTIHARVAPELVDISSMHASIDDTTSVVSITTDMMRTISIVEHNPLIEQTAYGVFGDIIRVCELL